MNPLIPKPGTAYQWLPMEDPTRRSTARSSGCAALMAGIDNVYFNIKSERHSYYQALLSLGDRRVAPAIEAAERNGQNWRAAVAEAGVDADFYIFRDRSQRRRAAVGHHRRRHEGVVLPGRVRQERSARSGRCRRSAQQENARLLPVHPVAASACDRDAADVSSTISCDRRALLVLLERLQNQLAQLVLRRRVDDRPQQREAAPLAVDAVLARRET